ncbi:MAG: hemerythrin domain-containing protein, partial [Candidatus Binataceae bacterium]
MLTEEFSEVFRDEHRRMRDMLLGLIEAFQTGDREAIRTGIEEMAAHAGPHFLYEQETLYPALADVFGWDYVNKLLVEHDSALDAALELAELAEREEIDEEASRSGLELVRQLLPHASERDGLSVMVEVLEPQTVKKIRTAQEKASKSGTTLSKVAERRKGRRATAKAPARVSRAAGKPKTAHKQG